MSSLRSMSKASLRVSLQLAAALAIAASTPPARAEVFVYDDHDGHAGGTVGWAGDWPFARAGGELLQGAGYPRRRFNSSVGGAGQTLWIAVTGRMDAIIGSYSYHTAMGTTGWHDDHQFPGLHFANGLPTGFVTDDDSVSTGIAATAKQTWLASFEFGPQLSDGRHDIFLSVWAGPGGGETINVAAPPRFTTLVEDATVDSMYAGQSTVGNTYFVDREAVASTPEEALGLRRDLFIVAHQDDDLLFMNPDLSTSIRSGNVVRTLYITDGAAGAPEMRDFREQGIMSAYAQMSGAPNQWTVGELVVSGKRLKLATLDDRLSLIFLRIPASPKDEQFPTEDMQNNLARLYSYPGVTVQDTNHGDTYDRAALIEVLSTVIEDYAPTRIGTLDSTIIHGGDHQEHTYSALFANEARNNYSGRHEFHIYRGYNINDFDPPNLTAAETDAKRTTFRWYSACDHYICNDDALPEGEEAGLGCTYEAGVWTCPSCGTGIGCISGNADYAGFVQRLYKIGEIGPSVRKLVNRFNPSRCLARSDNVLVLETCANVARQRFTLNAQHQLIASNGRCVSTSPSSTAVTLVPCAGVAEQRWTIFEDGFVLGAGGVCLEPTDGLQNATTIDAQIGCVGYDTQKWNAVLVF